jgi:hypothetical protein
VVVTDPFDGSELGGHPADSTERAFLRRSDRVKRPFPICATRAAVTRRSRAANGRETDRRYRRRVGSFRSRLVEVVELDDRLRRAVIRRHPRLSGFRDGVLVVADSAIGVRLLQAVRQLVDSANDRERRRADELVDSLCPPTAPATPEAVDAARRRARQRLRLLEDFGGYAASEVAVVTGSSATNRSQVAYRLRRGGRIFAVPHRGTSFFLGFQFGDDGQPIPVIADVVAQLGHRLDPWDLALWFVRSNGALDGRRPTDLLTADPDAVRRAARFDAGRVGTLPQA